MTMRASFVEGIMSMVRVRICSKRFLIAPLKGLWMIVFQYSTHSKGINQKSIWWRTAGSNSVIANRVTVRRAEVSLFRLLGLRFDCIHSSVRSKGGSCYICRYLYYFINLILIILSLIIIPHQGKKKEVISEKLGHDNTKAGI